MAALRWLLVGLGILLAAVTPAAANDGQARTLIGYVEQAAVITARVDPNQTGPSPHTASFWEFGLPRPGNTPVAATRYVLPVASASERDDSLRWRVSHGCLWYTRVPADIWTRAIRIPRSEWSYFDAGKDRKDAEAAFRRLANEPPGRGISQILVNRNGQQLVSLNNVVADAGLRGGTGAPMPTAPIFFDFLPVSETSILLFVLETNRLRMYRSTGAVDPQSKWWRLDWVTTETATMAVDFPPEPFHVFGTEERFYLLTKSGQLFGSERPTEGARTVKQARVFPRPAVSTLVVDNDARRYHVFAVEPQHRRGTYLELGRQVPRQMTEADLRHLPAEERLNLDAAAWAELGSDDPVKRMQACVRLLMDRGKLTAPSAK